MRRPRALQNATKFASCVGFDTSSHSSPFSPFTRHDESRLDANCATLLDVLRLPKDSSDGPEADSRDQRDGAVQEVGHLSSMHDSRASASTRAISAAGSILALKTQCYALPS